MRIEPTFGNRRCDASLENQFPDDFLLDGFCGLQRGFGSAAGGKRPPSLVAMAPAWRHGLPGREGLSHCRPQTLLSPATRDATVLRSNRGVGGIRDSQLEISRSVRR